MLTASRPVMPWMMNVVSLVIRIDIADSLSPQRRGSQRSILCARVSAVNLQLFIFATARPAASYIDTVRSQYSTP